MVFPSYENTKNLIRHGEYKVVPLSCEICSDIKTPVEVLRVLKSAGKTCFLLESAERNETWGRYTFLGFEPRLAICCRNGELQIVGDAPGHFSKADPREAIRRILKENKSPRLEGLPPFTGGLVGYFSYDYLKYGEPSLALSARDPENFSDVNLMLFDKVIAFDNYRQKIIAIVNIRCGSFEEEYSRGTEELERLVRLIRSAEAPPHEKGTVTSDFRTLFSKEEYCERVDRAKEYIRQGDAFQIVLSNRMEAEFEGSLFDTYRILRTINPSPYMFYLSDGDVEIAGASPETLLKLQDGKLYTFPLAGTRPRGKTNEEDALLEKELLADEKERAEHNMLVDLGRNDIGRVSDFKTVRVETYMAVERFSHVMHLGSTVTGALRKDCDALDALDAVLPAGTLSGAPKIRACQIIDELEGDKRGVYGGAIGYIDFAGNMDTCIAIRIAYKKNGKVFIRTGAGIVADSVPEREYEECQNKAKAVLQALKKAQEGEGL